MKNFLTFPVLLLLFVGCAGTANTSFYKKPNAKINLSEPAVVISDKAGFLNDMTFADMLSVELLKDGLNLMDRSTVEGLVKEKGFDWDNLLSQQQFIKIGDSSPVKIVIIINAQMIGQMVSQATCRILNTKTGELLASMSVTNPQPYNNIYLGNKSTSDIIKDWANQITAQ